MRVAVAEGVVEAGDVVAAEVEVRVEDDVAVAVDGDGAAAGDADRGDRELGGGVVDVGVVREQVGRVVTVGVLGPVLSSTATGASLTG